MENVQLFLSIVSGIGVPVLIFVVSTVWQGRRSDKRETDTKLLASDQAITALRVHVAENYVTVLRLERLETAVQEALKRLEGKVDQVLIQSRQSNGSHD